MAESCAPLSDLWGYEPDSLALVGVINGVSIVDVSDDLAPTERAFFKGCLTEWRDIKTLGHFMYVVNDVTQLCDCIQQPCESVIEIVEGQSLGFPDSFATATEGKFSMPLHVTGNVAGVIATAEPANGCDFPFDTVVTGNIVMIQRGECEFSTKVRNAQLAGAIAAIIYNDREDAVPPSMVGDSDGITIPAVMIKRSDGLRLVEHVSENITVRLLNGTRRDSDMYSGSDGLVIVDLTVKPTKVYQSRQFFSFAHNIFIEEDRQILWACGTSCGVDDYECLENAPLTGGIVALDITTPEQPLLLASWNDSYIHDIVVEKIHGRYILYGAAIYDERMYRFDVTKPAELGNTVLYWHTQKMPHNSWSTPDEGIIYVTHEDSSMPVTIWDIHDITDVRYVGNFSMNVQNTTIPHNVFMRNSRLWMSYYSEGVLVYDVSHPKSPLLMAHFDTSPFFNGFHGVWGIYPTMDNLHAYASDIENGLFILELKGDVDTDPDTNITPTTTPTPPLPHFSAVSFVEGVAFAVVAALAIYLYRRNSAQPQSPRSPSTEDQMNPMLANEDDGL